MRSQCIVMDESVLVMKDVLHELELGGKSYF